MSIFMKLQNKLKNIKEIPFNLEKDLQNLVENNLENILFLKIVQSEFVIKDYRFDTLAFNEQEKSFVIIEYKKGKNYSVIDQGMTYLGLLLDNKANFVLAYQEKFNKYLKQSEFNWENTKLIFVSPSFTDFQTNATFQDLPIELLEVKQYEGDIVIVNPIKKANNVKVAKTFATENEIFEKIVKEIKVYTEEDHLRNSDEETIELYEELKNKILDLDSQIKIEAKKLYIAFKKQSNVCDIEIKKHFLKIYVNVLKGKLDDPKHLFRDISEVGHWGNGDYCVSISDNKELEYIMSVIKSII